MAENEYVIYIIALTNNREDDAFRWIKPLRIKFCELTRVRSKSLKIKYVLSGAAEALLVCGPLSSASPDEASPLLGIFTGTYRLLRWLLPTGPNSGIIHRIVASLPLGGKIHTLRR
jgi:hypothetical protein